MKLGAINSIQHKAWLHDPVTIQLLKELDIAREHNQEVAEGLARNTGDMHTIKDFVLRSAIIASIRAIVTEPETVEQQNETQ